MKKFSSVFMLAGMFLIPGFAKAQIVVENVSQETKIIYSGPYILGGQVQTTTIFNISVESCAGYINSDFEVKIEEIRLGLSANTENFVTVQFRDLMYDCMGPTSRRNYIVKTRKLARDERYVLTNPAVLKPQILDIVQPLGLN